MFLELIQNIALLVTLAVGLQMLTRRLERRPTLSKLAEGLLYGAVGLTGMMTPMHFAPGIIYDGRSIVLSLAGLFGGPVAAGISAVMCAAYRIHLGGAGMMAGVGVVIEAAGLGVAFHYLRRRDPRWIQPVWLWAFGLAVHAVMMALQVLLIPGVGWHVLARVGPMVLAFYPLGFLLIAQVFLEAGRRQKAERSLRENEERFRSLVEGAPDAIFVQTGGSFAYLNAAALRLFGASAQSELLGRPVADRFHPSMPEAARRQIESLGSHEAPAAPVQGVYLRLDGGEAPVEVSAVPTVYEGREGAIVFARDISARRKLEGQLVQAQKLEAIGRLAGGVAHDFNNMLQTILGYSDILLSGMDRANPSHEPLEEIRKAARRSADLTRQLLAFARKQTIAPRTMDLNAAIADMLKMLQRLIGENIDLLWKPCGDLCPVDMDPAQIDQVLANLVVNARDAIPGVGKITIETAHREFDEEYCTRHVVSRPGRYQMLAVSDNGKGMDRQTLAQAFEPFFTTKGLDRGTGLGLATVYGIVKQNHGFIDVYSEPGQGTTVRIYLPRAQTPVEAIRDQAGPRQAPGGSETILLVEDEAALLTLSTHILHRLGYTVLPAGGPKDALRILQEHTGPIHLLMTDVIMPERSGYDLWAQLREIRPHLKCLFMSGYTDNVLVHHGVLDKGIHFLQKPFALTDLARELRSILDGDEESPTPGGNPVE